jgi:flavin-dependent dehydrogenase
MKTAIIGGGISGFYLGLKLAQKNNKIIIYEKKSRIENVVCSGLFSERILDFIPKSKTLIENKIESVFIHFPKKTIKIKFSKAFLVMSHLELDKLTHDLAKKAGAEIIFGETIKSLPQNYERIIGCDGYDSFVRKHLCLKNPKFRLGIQGFIQSRKMENYVEVWPLENKSGFIWKIPRKNQTEYGIIGNPVSAVKDLKSFLSKKNISLDKVASKIIPMGLIIPDNDLITLCGDAMGLTKPWSGGGVIWGLTAADMLIETFPNFKKYSKKVERFFKWKIKRSQALTNLVYLLGFNTPWILPKNAKIESDFLL